MAHEVETLTYYGQVPWHGLGNPLPEEGLRDWKIACETAGLSWKVVQETLLIAANGHAVESHVANVRASDNKILGVVGSDYEVLQNCEAFEWFGPILESGDATIEAAGALRGGSRIFALAKISGAEGQVREFSVNASTPDNVNRYILLSHSHDGSLAVRVGITDIRVICHNTLTAAHDSESSKLIRLRHTKNVKKNLETVREILDVTRQGFFATLEQYRLLASAEFNQSDILRYVELVFNVDPNLTLHKRTKDRINQIVDLAYHGKGNNGATLWDAYNAVTEFTSWHRGTSNETRLNSVWFGDSAKLNKKAFDTALELVA